MTFVPPGQQLMASPNSAFYSLARTSIEASDKPFDEVVPHQSGEAVAMGSSEVAASLSTPFSLVRTEARAATATVTVDDQSARSTSSGDGSSIPSTATSSLTYSPGGQLHSASPGRDRQETKQRGGTRADGGTDDALAVASGTYDDQLTRVPKLSPEAVANRKRERAFIRQQRHRSDQRQYGILLTILGLCTIITSMNTLLIQFGDADVLDISYSLTSFLLQICGVIAIGVGLMIGVLDTGDKVERTIWITRSLLFVIILDFASHYLIGVLRFGHDALAGTKLDFIPTSYNPSPANQRVVGSLGLLSHTAHFLSLGGGLFLTVFLLHHSTKYPCSRTHRLTAPFYRQSAAFFITLLMVAGSCQWVLSVYILDVLDLPGPLRAVEVTSASPSRTELTGLSDAPSSALFAIEDTGSGNRRESDRGANIFDLGSDQQTNGPTLTVVDFVPTVAPTSWTTTTSIGGPVQIDPLYVIYYPEINGIVGVLQFLSGFFGFIRCSCQRLIGYEDDGLYQVLMALLWFATLILQIIFPLVYSRSGTGDNAPTQAALLVPLLLIPSYLDVKMRTTPETNDLPSRRRRRREHDVEDQRSDLASSAMDSISTSQDHTASTSGFRTPPQSPLRRHPPRSSSRRTAQPRGDNDSSPEGRSLLPPNLSPRDVGVVSTLECTDLELMNATRASEVVMPVLTKPSSAAEKATKQLKPLAPRPLRPGSSASLRTIFDQQQKRRQRRRQQQQKEKQAQATKKTRTNQEAPQSTSKDASTSLSPTPRETVATVLPPPTNIRRTLHSLLASIDEEQDDAQN